MLETVLESYDGTAETLAGVFGDQLWTGMRLIKVGAAGDQFANTAAQGF